MLMKLLKHEFRATGRVMLPMYLLLLATAVGSNFASRGIWDSDIAVLELLSALIVIAFGIAIFAVFVMAFLLMIQRFYKNLLQDEGYLMFTLPVSIHQHIWSKLIVSAVWFVLTFLAVLLASFVVAFDVGFLGGFFEFIGEIFRGLQKLEISETLNGTAFLIELFVLMFLGLMAFSLQFYAALAAGHSRPNHKMVWSVAAFFAFQFAMQMAGGTLLLSVDRFRFSYSWEPVFSWNLTPIASIHMGLLIVIAATVIYGAIFYAVTTFFLKRHLNLE